MDLLDTRVGVDQGLLGKTAMVMSTSALPSLVKMGELVSTRLDHFLVRVHSALVVLAARIVWRALLVTSARRRVELTLLTLNLVST